MHRFIVADIAHRTEPCAGPDPLPLGIDRAMYRRPVTLPSELRTQLIAVLREKAVRRLPEPIRLSSGALSYDFVDGKAGLCAWRDLRLAGEAIVEAADSLGLEFGAVGGLTLGADALAVAVAAAADCDWFFVRKEAKAHGTGRQIEGAPIGSGSRVLLVDDAVTSGGSILQAYDVVSAVGAQVVGASTLIDRGDVAAAKFAARSVPYLPMATYADLGLDPVIVAD